MLESVGVQSHAAQRPLVNKGRALVVDEDRGDLTYYRAILQRAGWVVVTSSSYEGSLEFFRSEAFDLVIISQGSCAFEGRRVLEHAVMVDRKRPVLVVAHAHDMGCYLEAMRLGAADYLEEPIAETELMRTTDAFLSGSSAAA
ncbi:MAG: response regulator [Acidobacteria bacterium]|nr:response regulator [Acidobacteriota bacterium]